MRGFAGVCHRFRIVGVCGVGLVVFALTACSGPGADAPRDESARAVIDFDAGSVVLPIDKYDITVLYNDRTAMDKAREIAEEKCMTAKGFTYSAARIPFKPGVKENRMYGIFSVKLALSYGFGNGEKNPDQAAIEADLAAGGKPWSDAYEACRGQLDPTINSSLLTNEDFSNQFLGDMRRSAYSSASDSPIWQAAREKWRVCLRSAGYTPLTGSTSWGAQEEETLPRDPQTGRYVDKQAEIKIAYAEANCNVQTGLTQTLANLEASYQQPLVDKNQAALNKVLDSKEARLKQVQDYIAA